MENPASSESPKRTLLIVDDEEGPRKSLSAVFKNHYHVLLADNGFRALEIARQQPVDAAMLDIRMSGMSGIELLAELKKLDASIEVIMLTAYETIETARQALRLGASDYLDKPFDVATVRTAVTNAMMRRSLADDIRANTTKLKDLQTEMLDRRLREEIARTRSEIYASIIHDLNGPLTIICGFVDIINRENSSMEGLEFQNGRKTRDHLGHITRQLNKCIDISHRYLSFIRQRTAQIVAVSVNQILGDLHEHLRVHPDTRQNRLTILPLHEDVKISINGIDLIQILLNLSVNALQCTDQPHAVEIQAHRIDQPVEWNAPIDDHENRFIRGVDFDPGRPLIALKIVDNGPGIPPEVLGKMFKSYFTTKPVGKGTGLGLSIVLRFVSEAGGAIRIQTSMGRGTIFTVYLPAG
jgi:signal transduction histidine kinase